MNAPTDESLDSDIYVIPVLERWLLFSPRTWTAAVVNRSAVTTIAQCFGGNVGALSGDLLQLWRELARPPVLALATGDDSGKLVIMPTRACNMHCVYCDFAAANAAQTTLDPQRACRLIDDFSRQLQAHGNDTLRLHFFGGEPLVARQCTETIVHYARSLCAQTGLIPWFELTTNGFFDPGVVPFIGDYIDSVVISLDGTEARHDYNRRRHDGGGTFAEIASNIHRLARFPVELCLRMCVTDRSVNEMADIAARFCNEYEFDVLSFEMLAENECGRRAGLNAPDPYAFAAGVLRAEALASPHGVRVVHGPSELVGPRTTSCPLGQGTRMLAPDGQLMACYLNPERWTARGLDLAIGYVDASAGVSVDRNKLDAIAALVRSKPRCARCFGRYTCAGGCHVDQTPPGCSLDYETRCRAIRVITAARLLRSLGCGEDAEALVNCLSAMEVLANHPDDRLASWNDNSQREKR